MECEIVYEDPVLLVIRKPAGVATQTADLLTPDVVSFLKNHLKTSYIGLVHRLDQPVEGLLACAKTKSAAAALSEQLLDGRLKKSYLALVHEEGFLENLAGQRMGEAGEGFCFTLEDELARDAKSRRAVVSSHQTDSGEAGSQESGKKREPQQPGGNHAPGPGKQARLSAQIVKQMAPDIWLCRIEIGTGRFHQIRAQMAAAGAPLLGDQKYGTPESLAKSRELSIRRICLCADRLSFVHPVSGEEMDFSIEPSWS